MPATLNLSTITIVALVIVAIVLECMLIYASLQAWTNAQLDEMRAKSRIRSLQK